MNIFPFKATNPTIDLITSPESFFDNVKTEFINYKQNGFYTQSEEAAFYIYSITKKGKSYSGIIADTDIEDYVSRGKILKHEKTLVSKEQTMIHLILHRQAMVKPVLVAFPEVKEINTLLTRLIKSEPVFREIKFKTNGEAHSFRKITAKKDIEEIKKIFATKLDKTYIADGHHRCSTMGLLYNNDSVPGAKEKFGRLLTAFFPFNQLHIESYNRVIDMTESINAPRFMASLSKYFNIRILEIEDRPTSKHQITMFLEQTWYHLSWKKEYIKSGKKSKEILDTALFNQHVLSEILEINDVRFDTRITYISGAKGTKGLIKKTNEKPLQVGFCLPSVKPKEIISIVDEGRTLPPKSTWFVPRLRSGFIVKEFS